MQARAFINPEPDTEERPIRAEFTGDDGAKWIANLTVGEAMVLYADLRLIGVNQ